MNAREKAKELVDKYSFVEIPNYTSFFEVKQCALIAVEELINEAYFTDSYYNKKYWKQVKTEIEKL